MQEPHADSPRSEGAKDTGSTGSQHTEGHAAQHGEPWLSQTVLQHVTQDARLRDALLSHASHALRTPLNAIQGWTYVLAHQLNDTEDGLTRRALDGIRTGIDQQVALLDRLMDASRLLAGRLRLAMQPLPLLQIITAAVEEASEAARARQIDLEVRCELGEGPMQAQVEGDARRLERIVAHLLNNALRYTPAHGRVTLEAWCEDNMAHIRVSDTGMGIAADRLPHLFDGTTDASPSSVRADAATRRAEVGSGLGLFISSRLAALHGGALTADSAGPDRGSTFTLSLPLRASASGVVH